MQVSSQRSQLLNILNSEIKESVPEPLKLNFKPNTEDVELI